MNARKISEALGLIGDRYIEEAAQYSPAKEGAGRGAANFRPAKHGLRHWAAQYSPAKKRAWRRAAWGAAAACLALAVWAGFAGQGFGTRDPAQSGPASELPLLPAAWNETGGMGYEGYMAYDVSELVSANPWREEMDLTTLPVYRNTLHYNEQYIPSGMDTEKMRAFLLEVAEKFGLDPNTLTVTDNAPDEEYKQAVTEKLASVGETVPEGMFDPTELCVEANGLKISVDEALTARINFDPAVSLPDGLRFAHHASYEETAAVAEYLKTAYASVLDFRSIQTNISGGDYNIYAENGYTVSFFDGGGSAIEQIIAYNFHQTAFYCNDNGRLSLARVYGADLSDKAGDYPIISAQQARRLLVNGNYITTVPYEMPGEEYIRKVELIYRVSNRDEYFMPYYRFYVEMPEGERENGLKDFGAYYVPAVDGAYLTGMPVWDGGFN